MQIGATLVKGKARIAFTQAKVYIKISMNYFTASFPGRVVHSVEGPTCIQITGQDP